MLTMFNLRYFITLIFCFISLIVNAHAQQTTTIAFGSCAEQYKPQPIWLDIASHQPDAFLYIGDNVYADNQIINGERVYGPVDNPERFAQAYQEQANIAEFAAFREQVPLFMGTWDDHDFGANDAGSEFSLKHASQQAFLDFFNFGENSPIRKQEGIYHANTIEHSGHKIQIIMLDTRFHLGERVKNPNGRPPGKGPYVVQADKTQGILGERQWQWLEMQLKQAADIRLLVSSFQVVAYEHAWETWGNFPHERQRLYNLIAYTQANGVLLLSGDRHLMEISKDTGQLGSNVPYPMWDFTASGLTQDFHKVNEGNTFRQGKAVRDTHFGLINIHWHKQDLMQSVIELKAMGVNNEVLEKRRITLSELQI